ncbi:thiamine pyrophosphate-binding protein [Actinomadura rubrisoli]|uniref:Thiamine pyrophosphate enzyme N-terminal TPP-binding domain-containing protein n=1 Tax=Actinomadura rubrisoli TaxID=2530368 RepID=A0A4V2YWD6_9ACTN|nr:thiamine pyrophosphate-binding protein [Actinomadura rubrisoli]TDD85027.1 hypothetical protein E1298_19140 [Actinomadura rubrisoli]
MTGPAARPGPQPDLADALAEIGFRRAYGVPDSVLAPFLHRLETRMPVHHLPREDLAVAAAAGAHLGGEDAIVFMKNAGLGNSLDAFLSLARASGIPVSTVMGMSGTAGDTLPHHTAVGERATALLDASGLGHRSITSDTTPRGLAQWLHRTRTSAESAVILVPPP